MVDFLVSDAHFRVYAAQLVVAVLLSCSPLQQSVPAPDVALLLVVALVKQHVSSALPSVTSPPVPPKRKQSVN